MLGGTGNGADAASGCSSPWRSATCAASVAPVAMTASALSPMWSQCRWVLMIMRRFQPSSVSCWVSQRTEGVAVSMAMASCVRTSPST
jgi:hypothetical protein